MHDVDATLDPRHTPLAGMLAPSALIAEALAALHETLLGTASPLPVAELGSADLYPLVALSYLGAMAVAAAPAAAIGVRYGPRRLLAWGLLLLLAGTLLGAAAPAMPQLLLGRAVAGLGGGGVLVSSLGLLARGSPPQGRSPAQVGPAVFTLVLMAAVLLGPLAGTAAIDALGWRWSLLLTVPFEILALAMAWRTSDLQPVPAGSPAPGSRSAGPGMAGGVLLVVAIATASAATLVTLVFLPVAALAGGERDAMTAAIAGLLAGAASGALAHARTRAATSAWRLAEPAGLVPVVVGLAWLSVPSSPGGAIGAAVAGALVGLGSTVAIANLLTDLPSRRRDADQTAGTPLAGSALAVASMQIGTLAGLGAAGVLFVQTLQQDLVVRLQPIVDDAIALIPSDFQGQARALAEAALRSITQNLDFGELAGSTGSFGDRIVAMVPHQFRSAAEPFVGRLDRAYADAMTTALGAAFELAALTALVAIVVTFVWAVAGPGHRPEPRA